jgi:hypothetical protein
MDAVARTTRAVLRLVARAEASKSCMADMVGLFLSQARRKKTVTRFNVR